jgi:4'-phosphopantetheinyl transferase
MSGVQHGPPTGEAHVWAVREPPPGPGREAVVERCLALLTPPEVRRYERVVRPQRALHACAHAALRAVTAAYTGLRAPQVAFTTGEFGKPYVASDPGLRVSLAHTAHMALVAVTRDGPVGVDVERITALHDPVGMRRQVLSPWEAARWPESADDALQSGLFTHWTCKEAVLKAIGSGLAGDLTAIQVAPGARRSGPVPVHALPADAATRTWALQLIDLGPEYRAAVAVADGGSLVRAFHMAPGSIPSVPPALPAPAPPVLSESSERPGRRTVPDRGGPSCS